MNNTCSTCQHWIPVDRYTEGREKKSHDMACSNPHFDFGGDSATVLNDGITVDAYHVSCGNCNFITGPNFGCIHHLSK
jgi:hypothetical protein